VIDPGLCGRPHDILFADVDGDGRRELVCSAMYTATPGLFIYKPAGTVNRPWKKHTVQEGLSLEGLDAADVDGDGRLEIIQGPCLFHAPDKGPFAGKWRASHFAPGFREMCRAGFADITRNGRPDIVLCESEYPDGRFSWFENRSARGGSPAWLEHRVDAPLNFAHSLSVVEDRGNQAVKIYIAEMAQGGWSPPYNWDARHLIYTTEDRGGHWRREMPIQGPGTHEARLCDIDKDGELEIIGKECWRPRIQIWKKTGRASPLLGYKHKFVDREKPGRCTDILAVDVNGTGRQDIVCGSWWYRAPDWTRFKIPGVEQVIEAHDIDGDGKMEFIAVQAHPDPALDDYQRLSSRLCWIKPVDPQKGQWERHVIGTGSGDWPHGAVVAPFMPKGHPALVISYHDFTLLELFRIPNPPAKSSWPKRPVAVIKFKEGLLAADIFGRGRPDIVAGQYLLENKGKGNFSPHLICEAPFIFARTALTDINGNGRPDIVFTTEDVDYKQKAAAFSPVGWLENPGRHLRGKWPMHVIDTVRSPHSVSVADLDRDGEAEVIVGEHDPFRPYRSRSRLLVYKKADGKGRAWKRYVLDDRFEHHCGAKPIDLGNGRIGIISHGWADSRYVHLWEPG
jgi:hypothetical protein